MVFGQLLFGGLVWWVGLVGWFCFCFNSKEMHLALKMNVLSLKQYLPVVS